jgi:glycosyltransferase involved in cell wall biosynthesis
MRIAIISHKVCWKSPDSPSGYQTDGGFILQVKAISELFDETKVVVPCAETTDNKGVSPLVGHNLQVSPLSSAKLSGLKSKLNFPFWLMRNSKTIWREIRRADAVHAPIPGDVGTVGILFALLQRKPLFVRHCGNWLVQRTAAEQFWKWIMERFAGGRNVMFATGGTDEAPSKRNSSIKWIFSTSLRQDEMENMIARKLPDNGELKLITACRVEDRKGVDIVIESLPLILKKFPNATLDIVGDGSMLGKLKARAKNLNIEKKITFHGKVKHFKVIELMKQADVFCFPTSASEGFPKVVVEALACGLPVITTKVSVLPRLIGNGAGVLLDQPTMENLAGAVKEICSDAEKYNQMSSQAIATAQRYSLENWRDFIGENLRREWKVSSLSAAR